MKKRFRKQAGFTLIELLIVVAIIGILAAIAIPNFLQAQVRAKVSRTQSDMRSTAMGIELYSTDNGSYPMDAQYYTVIPALASFLPRLARLTTPVDYIASVPEDVFAAERSAVAELGTGPIACLITAVPWCVLIPSITPTGLCRMGLGNRGLSGGGLHLTPTR